jgi:hypothetical protein
MRVHLLACLGRKLHVEIFGEQSEHLFAVLIMLM